MRDSIAIIRRDQIKRFFLMFFNNRIELLRALVSICLLKNRKVVGNDVALERPVGCRPAEITRG